MMTRILAVVLVMALTGCSTIESWIPSFWDDNQSHSIVSVRLAADRIDCDQPQLAQVSVVRDHLRWFQLYSQSKGRAQQDVQRVIAPMQTTVEEWWERSRQNPGSRSYCELKRRMVITQAERAASAILGRY